MQGQRTCGQGLAEHSVLPAKLGDLIDAVAENLEVHRKALDGTDEGSREENAAYRDLAKEHREIAARLGAVARQMAGYRDLPMGRHDPKAMASPKAAEAFERFVTVEQELLHLLQNRVARDGEMLSAIREAAAAASPR